MTMPKQKPGKSEQTVCTPRAFLQAVEDRYYHITFDLACTRENCVIYNFEYHEKITGFYNDEGVNALDNETGWPTSGINWCNPPFTKIEPWVRKAWEQSRLGARTLMLVPASVGSNWFRDWVFSKADVSFLNPRVTFVGHSHPFPKDLMLLDYNLKHTKPGAFNVWNWNGK